MKDIKLYITFYHLDLAWISNHSAVWVLLKVADEGKVAFIQFSHKNIKKNIKFQKETQKLTKHALSFIDDHS